jgi:hypothetical protein
MLTTLQHTASYQLYICIHIDCYSSEVHWLMQFVSVSKHVFLKKAILMINLQPG